MPITHPINPVFDQNSRVLILGTAAVFFAGALKRAEALCIMDREMRDFDLDFRRVCYNREIFFGLFPFAKMRPRYNLLKGWFL